MLRVAGMRAKPFLIDIPESVLADLRERLRRTRWPEDFTGLGWTEGTDVDYLAELIMWWCERFDWRAQERSINSFPHYRVDVDGHAIHFIHVHGRGAAPIPLERRGRDSNPREAPVTSNGTTATAGPYERM